jgi:hypothetical protein
MLGYFWEAQKYLIVNNINFHSHVCKLLKLDFASHNTIVVHFVPQKSKKTRKKEVRRRFMGARKNCKFNFLIFIFFFDDFTGNIFSYAPFTAFTG